MFNWANSERGKLIELLYYTAGCIVMILAGTWSLKIGIDAIKNDEKASAVHDPKLQIIPGAMSVVIGIIFLVKLVLIPLFE